MKSKCTALIFLHFLFLSCESPQISNNTPTNSSQVYGVLMNADTLQPAEKIPAGIPKAILAPKYTNQRAVPRAPYAHFTNYNTEDGLALSSVAAIYCDQTGQLWLGTEGGGVSKYVGTNFTNYTSAQGLANNTVRSILQDKNGTLWFGTEGGGVSKYNGRRFTSFNTAQGLASNNVRCMLEDKDGNLWLGTYGGGVSKYDGEQFSNFSKAQGLADNRVSCMIQDNNGDLWFGTEGGGLSQFNGKSFVNYTSTQGLANNVVKSMYEDTKGNLWIGTLDGGLSKYDGQTFRNFTTREGLADNSVLCITEDKTGQLWFGTLYGGLSSYDGSSFRNFTTDQGLANNTVLCITKDKAGELWLGTEGGGMSNYDGSAFSYYSNTYTSANHTIFSIIEDKDANLWLGTSGGGISKYDGKLFTRYTTRDGLANNTVFCTARDNAGHLWFGTYGGGITKYDGKSFTNYTTNDGLADNSVLSLFVDKSNNLWIGTYGGGASKYDGKSFTHFTKQQGIGSNAIVCITQDRNGNMWFGTQNEGVSVYDGQSFTRFTTDQGLMSNAIFCMTEDQSGRLWLGTENGLCVITSEEVEQGANSLKKRFTIKNYNVTNGLTDNFVTQVVQLPSGKIAVGMNVGFAIFNPNLPMTAKDKLPQLELFNSSTGYPIKDINAGQNCMYLDSKGIIWAATGDEKISLVRFDYMAINHHLNSPEAVIQTIKLNEEPVCYYTLASECDSITLAQQEVLTYDKILTPGERDSVKHKFKGITFDSIAAFYPLPKKLVLPYKHNNITIDYNFVEISRPFMVNYQYLLEGYDEDWSPVLKKHEATYGNIYEGTYTFKLRAQSPEGVWSEISAYTFTILPPWWRTWWMYTVYVLLAIAFIRLIVFWNGRKLKARAKQLTEEVRKATKEIVEQKKVVEEKHKEITDSINYAGRIQRALLASKELLDEQLNDYFILFKPKDVVSGDFYWAAKLNDHHFILVTADSTGHGVPGAIMSILNISCLEKAVEVEKLSAPNEILHHTRTKIIETLKRDGSSDGGKDGMDGSLLSFDFKNNQLFCASAYNPVWIIRAKHTNQNGYELIEIKGDKMPIGKHEKDHLPFTLHTIALKKGDVVYTLTDGYADQFGGERGKKFTTKRLQQLLLSIAHKPLAAQKQTLNEVFDSWKETLEQVDDVCLIAVLI